MKTQRRIEDVLFISNMEDETVGEIKYQATWIYNKKVFLTDLLEGMENEKDQLILEIKG